MFDIKRCAANPLISSNDASPWTERGARNPGVIWDGKKFRMIFTGNGSNDGKLPMQLGYAESADGVDFTMNTEPFVAPSEDESFFDHTGMDDARITEIDGAYYFTYASPSSTVKEEDRVVFDPKGNVKPDWITYFRRGGMARTTDWKNVEKLGAVTNVILADANHVLFPETFDGKYALLHRPTPFSPWRANHFYFPGQIWICFSEDKLDWGWNLDWEELAKGSNQRKGWVMPDDHLLVRPEYEWEMMKVGASGVPIPTDDGWLMFYHAVDRRGTYRVGLLLLDREDPSKVIARSPVPIFEPEAEYETNGHYPNCVFPCANVVVDDTIYMYYGSADLYCALATMNFKDALDYILTCRV